MSSSEHNDAATRVIAALFCMSGLDDNAAAGLRVVVIERVALQPPAKGSEEHAAFCSWWKWVAVLTCAALLALLLILLAVVLGPVSLVLCVLVGIPAPPAAAAANQAAAGADARAQRAQAANIAQIGSAVLSFSFFFLLPHPQPQQQQPLSESFDRRVDGHELLRGMALLLVLLLRRRQPFQQSTAGLLAVSLLLGLQYAACDVYLRGMHAAADYLQALCAPISPPYFLHFVSHPIITNIITTTSSNFPSFLASSFTLLSLPPLHAFISRTLMSCVYLRPALWHITGGPREVPQNEPFKTAASISRVLQLREGYRSGRSSAAAAHFSTEVLLKHCAYVGLADWCSSRPPEPLLVLCIECMILAQVQLHVAASHMLLVLQAAALHQPRRHLPLLHPRLLHHHRP